MPPVRNRPRQDPVSCQLCRVKKLRCDRQRPSCSNCTSRKLECEYEAGGGIGNGAAGGNRLGANASNTGGANIDDLREENARIKARLERIEKAVFADGALLGLEMNYTSQSTYNGPLMTKTLPTSKNNGHADEDTEWLEVVGMRDDDILPQFADGFEIRLHSMEQFISGQVQASPSPGRLINLPTKDVALSALEAYAEHVDAMMHMLHVERTRGVIEIVYQKIHARQEVDPGSLAFVLSLCSSIGYYRSIRFYTGRTIFGDEETATKLSSEWAKQALLALEQARVACNTAPLEAVQACILLTFVFYHIEGLTFRSRMLHGTAITMARDLELHRTDFPRSTAAEPTRAEIIETEVKRKLWWHLACTDWLLAFVGGPQEGVYSIHPAQMQLRMPRNITREDLNTKSADFERGADEPTVMSYYLQRIRLAITCREAVDITWQHPDPETIDPNIIKSLDAKLETQVHDLPRFLRLDIPTQQLRREYGTAFDQQLDTQGTAIHLMLYSRRCKLHLPFLVRAKSNSAFSFSRQKALESARKIFEVRRLVKEDDNSNSKATAYRKLAGMLQHIFYATVVLVMDICVNKDDQDQGRIAEVREALQVMEEAKESTPRGAKFYDSLVAVLEKHGVKLPAVETQAAGNGGDTTGPLVDSGSQAVFSSNAAMSIDQSNDCPPSTVYEGGMWQDFLLQGPVLDAQDWDALFSDLDMSMI